MRSNFPSGKFSFNGREITTHPLSSYSMSLEVARELKTWIQEKKFTLGVPQIQLPGTQ